MSDALWTIVGAAITAFAGTGTAALVAWLKNLKWVKKLNIEAAIDKAAELAIGYAESWSKKMGKKGAEKLNIAKEAFQEELDRRGIKLEAGAMEKRLEGIFAFIKDKIESKKPEEKPPAS